MRKTLLALIAGMGLMLLGISTISAGPANMSPIGNPAASQTMIVPVQMNNDGKRCSKQCRRLTSCFDSNSAPARREDEDEE